MISHDRHAGPILPRDPPDDRPRDLNEAASLDRLPDVGNDWWPSSTHPDERDAAAEHVDRLLARIPEGFAAPVRLRLLGLSQREIAEQMGLKQPSVSNRLANALERLRLVADLPDLDADEVFATLADHGVPRETCEIVAIYWRAHSQAVAGECVGRNQRYARRVLMRFAGSKDGGPKCADIRAGVARILSWPKLCFALPGGRKSEASKEAMAKMIAEGRWTPPRRCKK